jgi:hypothetical protein
VFLVADFSQAFVVAKVLVLAASKSFSIDANSSCLSKYSSLQTTKSNNSFQALL